MRKRNKSKSINTTRIGLLILISILFTLIIGILLIVVDKVIPQDTKNYKEDVMRFNLHLDAGQYEFIPNEDFWNRTHLYDDEEAEIQKQSTIIFIEDCNLKFSEYVLTKDTEYMKTNIDGISGWVKGTIPILNEDDKVFIRKFIYRDNEINANCIEVFPFNDSNFVLIYDEVGAKILDLDNKEITWVDGDYYECARVDIYSDTISCSGDLSSKKYYFNKYGEELNKNLKITKKILPL